MAASGAQGFVEGLQGGIASRNAMDKAKQMKHIRKMGISQMEDEMAGNRGMTMTDQMMQGGGDEEWDAFQADKDPALMRFGKWMGGKIKGMFGGGGEEGGAMAQASFASPEIQPVGPQSSGATTYGIPQQKADGGMMRRGYADGGIAEDETDEMKRQRAQAAKSTAALEARRNGEDAGGIREFGRDLAHSAGNVFDDTIAGAHGGQKLIDAADADLANASGAREVGTAIRGTGAAALTSAAETTGGLLKDVFVDNPVTQGVAGFLGFDGQGGEQQGIPAANTAPTTPEGEAVAASVNEPAAAEGVSEKAIAAAEEDALKNPNYTLLVDQGVRPEDLPSMTTMDWTEYRQKMTFYAGKSGMNPVEAHKMVDERITNMQMTGFQRQASIASKYLQTGQNREAAMALRQAYQYFPNGVTVKFGTMTDPKTGQAAIITMATDEETGEPTGQPMIVTTERLNTMVENMSDPSAFRTWTKDGRELQLEINKLQSSDDYRQGSLGIAGYNAETSRMGAMSGGGGGQSRSGNLADAKWFTTEMDKKGLMEDEFAEDPRLLEAMTGAMIRLTMAGEHQGIALEEVMQAYSNGGGTDGVQQLLQSRLGQ